MTALRESSEQFNVAERPAFYRQCIPAFATWPRGDGGAVDLPLAAPGGEPSAFDG